jgi:phage terminase large subunit
VKHINLHDWRGRPYQKPLWDYLDKGGKRAVPCWHRRAGKDEVLLHFSARSMIRRAGTYWYMLPAANQARKAIWDAVNPKTGRRRIDDAFPLEVFERRETDMLIKNKFNASTWQVMGSDNFGAGIGSPPVGVVFSEFSQSDPMAWAYLSPILIENGGWAGFPSTPRGHNHFEGVLQTAMEDPNWFGEILTVDQTTDSDGNRLVSQEALLEDLRDKQRMMGDAEGKALWMQEWYCSFDAAVPGSYYGDVLEQATQEGRITDVPFDPTSPVYVAFDLGMADSTAMWFVQVVGFQVRLIDYYEHQGVSGLQFYVDVLNDKPYTYARDPLILPHDAGQERLGQSKSVINQFAAMGYRAYKGRCVPRADIDPGIRAVRTLLKTVWIDKKNCQRGVSCLRNYHRKYDESKQCYIEVPVHDWSSHGCDAARMLATGFEPAVRPDVHAARIEGRYGNGGQPPRSALRSRALDDPWRLPTR